MDIAKFGTQKNADDGVWFEPVIFGVPMGVEFCVRGKDSDAVRKYEAEVYRETQAMNKNERERINWKERGIEAAARKVSGMRTKDDSPVTIGGDEIEDNSAGYKKIFRFSPEVGDAITLFAENRANFLPQEKKGSNEPSDNSST